MKNKIKKKKI